MNKGVFKIAKIILAIASAAIIAAGVWHWRYGRSVGTDIHTSTDGTMADIKSSNESARSELRDSREHLERAEEHVNRTADAVKRGEEAAGINAGRTKQLEKLISESRKLSQENQRIMRDIEAVNRERTKDI